MSDLEIIGLRRRVAELKEALWDIQEFTRGYGDIAGIVHRKAHAALATIDGGVES